MRGDIIDKPTRRLGGVSREQRRQRAEAIKAAEALRRRMRAPKNWRIRVRQNLGWWYSIFRQSAVSTVSVTSYDGNKTFRAMLRDDVSTGGESPMLWADHSRTRFTDPNKAVAHVVRLGRKFVNHVTAAVETQEELR